MTQRRLSTSQQRRCERSQVACSLCYHIRSPPGFSWPPEMADFTERRHLPNAISAPVTCNMCGFGTRRSYVLLFMCCYLTVQIHVPESTFTSGHLPASHERRPKRQQVACSFFSFRTSSRPLYPPSSAVPPCPRRHQVDCPRPVTSVLNDNRSPALSSP